MEVDAWDKTCIHNIEFKIRSEKTSLYEPLF